MSFGSYGLMNGTSAATPIAAGHFGLFFQMWHNDVFHNHPTGSSPFFSRPHFTTVKAAMINTAFQWPFAGSEHTLHRYHQGWGAPDVQRLYDLRELTFFVDQTDSLDTLESVSYAVDVAPGGPSLQATLTWPEPSAAPPVTITRLNDLDLKLVAPDGSTTYWGNFGLTDAMASSPGGGPNTVDTVENVFVTSPAAGTWTVEVIAADVTTDVDPTTPGTNAVFSLWVTGATEQCAGGAESFCTAGTSASGCRASLSAAGFPSTSAPSGFLLQASGVEGAKDGTFFFGTNGRQANPWGNGTSYQCVVPPVVRAGTLSGSGTLGACDGAFSQDLNALWCPTCPKPAKNPGAGALVQAQLWYRDPFSTSNQTTSLSDAIEFEVCP